MTSQRTSRIGTRVAAEARDNSRPSARHKPPNRAMTRLGFIHASNSTNAPGTPNVGPALSNSTPLTPAVSNRASDFEFSMSGDSVGCDNDPDDALGTREAFGRAQHRRQAIGILNDDDNAATRRGCAGLRKEESPLRR